MKELTGWKYTPEEWLQTLLIMSRSSVVQMEPHEARELYEVLSTALDAYAGIANELAELKEEAKDAAIERSNYEP